jgi:ABC-type transport system involved in multi-copper enzyme maturation permease subunit
VTPLAYLVGTLFLLNQGWNFALLLRVLNDPLAAPGPVMQFYFGGSFFIFWLPVIFICAALSMRLIAEERRQGTLEALLTAPLSPSQITVGKFVGAYGVLPGAVAADGDLLPAAARARGRARRSGRCWRGTSGCCWSARAS